jgi:GMP synthase-like glutamine amidotransferase
VRLNAWHQDQVIEPPPGAEVVGTSDFCRYAALLYDGRAFTVQAHPEFGPDTLKG